MDGKFIKTNSKVKTINAVDLFCGAGGTSTGLVHAVNELGFEIKLTAINHWDVAIATHSKNHEDVEHFCQSIDTIDPAKIVPGGRLQLLVASPECTHHSRARGGKPRSDQKRADAWLLMRWIEKLYVENILIENVKEFQEWGPLTAAGKPDKRHKGRYFQQFLAALRVNYNVEYRILNCADYGDPTTRERLFILARRNGKKIVWPERTHASRKELAKAAVQADLFGKTEHLKPWVAAREIIDWNLEGKSIFGRKKPLSENTMRRIYAGLMKYSLKPFIVPQFSGANPKGVDDPLGTITTTSRGIGFAEPFLVNLKNKDRRDRDINEPTFTQAAGGNHQGVVEPFLIKSFGNGDEAKYRAKSVDDPLGTVLASRNHHVLVEPFIVSAAHGGNTNPPRDIDEPLGSVLGSPKHAIVEPYIVNMKGQSNARSVDDPTFTQTNKQHQYLAEPFIVPFFGEREGQEPRTRDINEPAPTVTTNNRMGLCEPFIIGQQSGATPRSTDEPLPTIAAKGAVALAEPYIVKFYGNEKGAESIDDPLDTVTAKDRFGLCIPSIGAVLDIRFRMLQPHELAAAMSFPADYEFTGNRENKVKQIGNAVPLKTARALCKALLG